MPTERINPDQIDNSELVRAIRDMRADFKPETQNKVINLALRSAFFVPAIIKKNTGLVAGADNKVKFEDTPQATFLLITNKEKGTFFPAFTDREDCLHFKTDKEFQVTVVRFADLATLCERSSDQNHHVDGFIINPYSENLPFTMQILEGIKTVLAQQRQKAKEAAEAAASEDKPNITMTTNPDAE